MCFIYAHTYLINAKDGYNHIPYPINENKISRNMQTGWATSSRNFSYSLCPTHNQQSCTRGALRLHAALEIGSIVPAGCIIEVEIIRMHAHKTRFFF